MRLRKLLLFILFVSFGMPAGRAADPAPAIAAASDLKFALEEAAARFRETARREVKLTFGSSGNFYRQILQGAPFQLFLSADESFVAKLAAARRTVDEGRLYGTGRIVLFAPHGSALEVDAQFAGVRAALARNALRRFAIANPEHAPYGRAAEQVLRRLGLWHALSGKLVLGENVSQAAQFATSGSAEGGIVAYSLALSSEIAARGRYVLVPESLHDPLRQRMVLIKGAGPTARAFYEYLQAPDARAIFRRYGFVLSAEG